MSKDAHEHRFGALDGLRGAAAVYVVGRHIAEKPFFRGAELLVDFFFVLSGFVLAPAMFRAFQNTASMRKFVRARVFRMLPLQLFVLFTFMLMLLIQGLWRHFHHYGGPSAIFRGRYSLGSVPEQLTLTQSIFGPHSTWVIPSWSISTEFLSNFVIILVLWKLAPKLSVPVMLAIACVGEILTVPGVIGPMHDITHGWSSIWRGLGGMSVGLFARQVFDKHSVRIQAVLTGPRATVIETLTLGAGVIALSNRDGIVNLGNIPCLVIWFVLVIVFAVQGGVWGRFMGSDPMRNLGFWSFGIYIWHVIVGFALGEIPHTGWLHSNPWVFYVVVTIATVALASQTKRFVEVPLQEYGRRSAIRKTAT